VILFVSILAVFFTTGCDLAKTSTKKTSAAPAAPTLIPSESSLIVNWNTVSDATAYEVWYNISNQRDSASKFGNDVSGTSTIIDGLTNGTDYYVWLKAKNTEGTSDFSPSANSEPLANAINVKKGGTQIPSGSEGNDYGDIYTGGESAEIAFTIENAGPGALFMSSIALSGAQADQFSVNTSGTDMVVLSGSSTDFGLKFTPASTGGKSATLTITNNNTSQSAYTFTVIGNALYAPGSDWTERIVPGAMGKEAWQSIAPSSDGTKLAVVADQLNNIFTSP
jgi:hypothetical protein